MQAYITEQFAFLYRNRCTLAELPTVRTKLHSILRTAMQRAEYPDTPGQKSAIMTTAKGMLAPGETWAQFLREIDWKTPMHTRRKTQRRRRQR